MKKVFGFVVFAVLATSCTFYNYESELDRRDRIVGYYEVEEYSETYDGYSWYSINISKGRYYDELVINNFYGVGIGVYARLDFDKLVIPLQVRDGYEIEGVGRIFGNEIEFSYYVKDLYSNTFTDFCETVAWLDF